MAKREYVWVKTLSPKEKADIAARCTHFISEVLKPRFLPVVRPTEFNYPVDLFGKWRGDSFSFITRYRFGFPQNTGEEFNVAFTRLDHMTANADKTRFDIMWHRHTGQWWRLHSAVTLDEALHLIETEGVLQPSL